VQPAVTIEREPAVTEAQLIQCHQRAVWRFARWLGADPALADDVTQEAFVRLLQQRRRGRPVPDGQAELRAWLCTAARNLFLSARARSRPGVPVADLDELLVAFARHGGADDELDALDACLAALPPRARAAVELHYRQRLRHRDVAAALGMKAAGVKGLLQRVRAALARCIDERREA
jgi:RNA polymerase sigma-70 factor (ECF subfamily)